MLKSSEAIVLRSYPIHESDLLVSFFTRNDGKIKGVAKAAKKSKKRFAGALEPLSYITLYYDERERHELSRIESCDIIESPLTGTIDYERAAALAYVSEVLEQLLADRDAQDDVFRLTLSVLRHIKAGAIWMPLTYFDLWIARLLGLLPELGTCIVCSDPLNGRAFFHALADGLMCPEHKRLASSEMSSASRALAAQIFRSPIDAFTTVPWPRAVGSTLR